MDWRITLACILIFGALNFGLMHILCVQSALHAAQEERDEINEMLDEDEAND